MAGGAGGCALLHPDCTLPCALLHPDCTIPLVGLLLDSVLKKSKTCWADQFSAKPGPKHDANKHGTEQIKGGPPALDTGSPNPSFKLARPTGPDFCMFLHDFWGCALLHPDCTLPLVGFLLDFAFFLLRFGRSFFWAQRPRRPTRSGLILARPTRSGLILVRPTPFRYWLAQQPLILAHPTAVDTGDAQLGQGTWTTADSDRW